MAKKFGILLVLITIISLVFSSLIFAQTPPEFLVSWKAINYVPANYRGKILPSDSTPIEISFDLISGNKIVDVSKKEISWTINARTFASGTGMKKIRFNSKNKGQSVRITVFDYNGADLDKFLDIPVTIPEVALDAKIPNNNPLGLKSYLFLARPFFFNVSSLKQLIFNWKVNDQTTGGSVENPEALNLNLKSLAQPAETDLTISVSAQNAFNDLEFGAKRLNFKVK